jgi:putative sigma-54 modulation protein
MDVKISGRKLKLDAETRAHVERRLDFALGRFDRRIMGITVRLADLNGPRGGVDKLCRIDLKLRPTGALMIEERGADVFAAVDSAVRRLSHALRRKLERKKDRKKGGAGSAGVSRRRP